MCDDRWGQGACDNTLTIGFAGGLSSITTVEMITDRGGYFY